MKKENIITLKLEDGIEFDGFKITKIKFDLEHINRGWNKERHDYNTTRRSNYTADDIVDFFEQFSFYDIEWEEGISKMSLFVMGEKRTRYLAYVFDHGKKRQMKMVVDISESYHDEGIIITLY